jgi:hypothetical protein
MPESAEPLQRAQLLAALTVGDEILRVRRMASLLAVGPAFNAALAALVRGNSTMARTHLARLDHHLASLPDTVSEAHLPVQARASILAISEALAQHSAFFDSGALA